MASIKLLAPQVIELIAAGEVIERPSSIVKELLDNALDAHATQITIQVEKGGLDVIQVTDDGIGMDRDDLLLAIQPHATSKISRVEDLHNLTSLGFRGEALASIAAASTLTIFSRSAAMAAGHILRVIRHRPQLPEAQAMPVGTTIRVEDIFSALPARRKFLRKPGVELQQIQDIITQTALSRPEVGFDLFHGERLLLHVASNQTIEERVEALFGPELITQLIPLHQTQQFITVKGYLGKPQVARRYTTKQFLTVNGRPVAARAVSRIIKQLYGNLIEPKADPVFMIDLTFPPSLVDHNVHPRKETVLLMEEERALKVLQYGIETTLAKTNLTYHFKSPTMRDKTMLDQLATQLKQEVEPWDIKQLEPNSILQVDKVYLVYTTPSSIVFVDQHAAHERILFEQFKEAFTNQSTLQQRQLSEGLLITLPDSLQSGATTQTRTPSASAQQKIDQLSAIGFTCEPFGPQTLKITHVPIWFNEADLHTIVMATLEIDDTQTDTDLVEVIEPLERTIAYLACRSAIKAGDSLTAQERYTLITRLQTTPRATTCPHGRPTQIVFSLPELAKMFKRN